MNSPHEKLPAPQLISPRQFASAAGISEETVYRLLARGELEGLRFGRIWRLPVSQLQVREDHAKPEEAR